MMRLFNREVKQSMPWSKSIPKGEELPVLRAYLPSILSHNWYMKYAIPVNIKNQLDKSPSMSAPYRTAINTWGTKLAMKPMNDIIFGLTIIIRQIYNTQATLDSYWQELSTQEHRNSYMWYSTLNLSTYVS